MSADPSKPKPVRKKVMPVPSRRQTFKDALAATNRQYGGTLARLAKYEAEERESRS